LVIIFFNELSNLSDSALDLEEALLQGKEMTEKFGFNVKNVRVELFDLLQGRRVNFRLEGV
jgi:hypothetical protein